MVGETGAVNGAHQSAGIQIEWLFFKHYGRYIKIDLLVQPPACYFAPIDP